MRRAAGVVALLMLAGCMAAEPEAATRYDPWPAGTPVDPGVLRLLPQGVTVADLLLGSDACYYYRANGAVHAVRYDDSARHFYCIG